MPEIKEESLIVLIYKNFYGSGVDWRMIYHPIFDGPLDNYKNRDDVEIKRLYNGEIVDYNG